mgnify:CR=1 FL=1
MLTLIIRAIVIYLIVLVILRIMGKRQIAEMQPYELVATLIIADLACIPMTEITVPLLHGIVPLLALTTIHFFISILSVKSIKLRRLINGNPIIVIDCNGIRYKDLRALNMTLNDLYEGLRVAGYFSLEDIAYAIVETNGSLSVLPKTNAQPPTADDMKVKTDPAVINLMLINDGKVVKENMEHFGLDEEFLKQSIGKFKITNIKDVMIYTLNNSGDVYLQEKVGKKITFKENLEVKK